MLPERFVKMFKDAFNVDPVCENNDQKVCIFEEDNKIIVKQDGRVVAQFEDNEDDYTTILQYYTKKAGLMTPHAKEIEELLRSLFVNIIILTEVEDKNGFSHSQRVAKLAEEFAHFLGWSDEQAVELRNHALLHDVGKIAIEQLMLYSPTRLRTLELHYQDHPTMGAIYLSINESLWQYIPTARNHHERWDGKGFPEGLKGEEIPFYARIMAIIDYYDEVTNFVSADWDSEIKTPSQALNEIKALSGKFFDPQLTEKFIDFMTNVYGIKT